MKKWIEILGDALIIVFGLWSLLMFVTIWQYGTSVFIEPNSVILTIETVVAIMIILIGVERFIDDSRRLK